MRFSFHFNQSNDTKPGQERTQSDAVRCPKGGKQERGELAGSEHRGRVVHPDEPRHQQPRADNPRLRTVSSNHERYYSDHAKTGSSSARGKATEATTPSQQV